MATYLKCESNLVVLVGPIATFLAFRVVREVLSNIEFRSLIKTRI